MNELENLVLTTIAWNKKHPETISDLDIDDPNLEPELKLYWLAFEDACKHLGIDTEGNKIEE